MDKAFQEDDGKSDDEKAQHRTWAAAQIDREFNKKREVMKSGPMETFTYTPQPKDDRSWLEKMTSTTPKPGAVVKPAPIGKTSVSNW